MFDPKTLKLSPSAIRAYRSCPYRYALDYVQRLPDSARVPVPLLAFGNAIHQTLADFIREGGWAKFSKDDLVALFMGRWDGSVYEDEDQELIQFHHGKRLLEGYFDRPYPDAPITERGVEVRLNWTTPRGGILATGKIDRLCETDDGRLLVIDYKVGRYHPLCEDDLSVQAAFYRSLVADTVARAASKSIEVVFHFLGSQATLNFGFTREEFRWVWGEIDVTAERIRLATKSLSLGRPLWVAFPLRRGQQCFSCPMMAHCENVANLPEREAARFYPNLEEVPGESSQRLRPGRP